MLRCRGIRKYDMFYEQKVVKLKQSMNLDEGQGPDCEGFYMPHKDFGL